MHMAADGEGGCHWQPVHHNSKEGSFLILKLTTPRFCKRLMRTRPKALAGVSTPPCFRPACFNSSSCTADEYESLRGIPQPFGAHRQAAYSSSILMVCTCKRFIVSGLSTGRPHLQG